MHFLPDVYVPCEVCGGSRFNRDTLEIMYHGKNIAVATMPTWLRDFATYQPVSVLVDASRKLMVNFPANTSNWSAVESIFWSLGAIAILLPLAVYKFSKAK